MVIRPTRVLEGAEAVGAEDGMVKEVKEPTQAEGNGVNPGRNKPVPPMSKTAVALLVRQKITDQLCPESQKTSYRNCLV